MKIDGYVIKGKYLRCTLPKHYLPLYIKLKDDNIVFIELSKALKSRPIGSNARERAHNARELLLLVSKWLENFKVESISRYK